MSYIEALQFYFKNILDITTYISVLLVTVGLCIFEFKNTDKKSLIRLGIVFVFTYCLIFFLRPFMFALNAVTHVQLFFNYCVPVLIIIYLIFVLKEKPTTKFMKISLVVAAICTSDVLSKYFGFVIGNYTEVLFFVSFARFSPTFLFIATCYVLKKFDISIYKSFTKESFIICYFLSFLLVATSIYEHKYTSTEVTVCLLMSILDMVLLLILNIAYFAVYNNIKNRHRITNLEVQKTLVEAENLAISIDKNNREELQKIRHDIKNQFTYLKLLVQQNKNDEVIEYIDKYVEGQQALSSFSSSNNVINAIINLEITKSKVYDVELDLKVAVPPVLPFDDNDIVSLLTNMIDNALENYFHREDSNNPISVYILKQNDYIRFFVANQIDTSLYDLRNVTKSRKQGSGHGYGTKIIRSIAKKYNGYVNYSIEGEKFLCDVLLYLNVEGK